MESDVEYLHPGGGGYQDLRHLLNVGISGVALVSIGDVGDDPPYWPKPGGVQPQDGLTAIEDATTAQRKGGDGSIYHWWKQCRQKAWSRWRCMSSATKTS